MDEDTLNAWVRKLQRIHIERHSFLGPGLEHAELVGREIEAKHGHDGMVVVCDEIRKVIGGGPARELESSWNGIGQWLG